MDRIIIKAIIGISFVIAITVIAVSVVYLKDEPAAWATVAAALSIITALLSSWSAQRVLEIQEDQQKPYPYPSIDATSRYGLVQLQIKNFGGGVARNIKLDWEIPLTNSQGEITRFNLGENDEIPVLLPYDTVLMYIDGQVQFFQYWNEKSNWNFSGTVHFEDNSGRKFNHPFFIGLEHHARGLSYTNEEARTHYELQKLPQELQRMTNEIRSMGTKLSSQIQASTESAENKH